MALTPKKKKDFITLAILGVIVIALIVSVVLITGWQAKKAEEDGADASETSGISLWSYDISEVIKASVKVGSGEEVVICTNGTDEDGATVYAVENEAEFPLDQTKAESIFGMAALELTEKVFESHEDISQFGLAEPEVVTGIETTGGNKHTLYIGDKVPGKSSYYAMVEGDPAVYTVSTSSRNSFAYTIGDLMEIDTPPAITLDTIRRVLIASEEFGSFELFYDSDPDQAISGMIVNLWFIGSPFKTIYEASSDEVQTFLQNYTTFTIAEAVDYREANLPKYGLGEGEGDILFISYVTPITTAEGETEYIENYYALYVGDKTEDGEYYYVKQNDSNNVYLMSVSSVDKMLDVDAETLVSKYINMVYISTLSKLTVNKADKTHVVEFEYATEVDDEGNEKQVNSAYTVDGKKFVVGEHENEIAAFKKLYQAIIGVQGDKLIKEELEYNKKDVIFSVLYERTEKDYKELSVEYLPYNDSYYAVRINGEFLFLADCRDIDAMIATVEEYEP